MIEPITYLYYKCYKLYAFFNKENPAFQYGVLFGVIIYINIAGLVILINKEFPLFDWRGFIILIMSIVLESIVSHFEDRMRQSSVFDGSFGIRRIFSVHQTTRNLEMGELKREKREKRKSHAIYTHV